MKNKHAIATLLAAALLPVAAYAADGTFDKTLSVNGAVQLTVSTGSGYVHVTPGTDNQVHIIGHVHASHGWMGGGSDEDVKRVVANPPIEQSGNVIRVGGHMSGDWWHHVSIDYDVSTPRNTSLKAESGSGDVHATGIQGGNRLETGSGSINAENLGGDSYLDTGSGDIHAGFSGNGNVKAETGSGSIKLEEIRGGLKAETGSGDITISGHPAADWKLVTGSGSIELSLGSSKYTLDAETGSGGIHSDQPISMQGSLNAHHVTGNVNGGGPLVKAQTGSGGIRIH